jgi:monovalent cation:H+ antiporter-2, CPA2 family
VPHGLFPDLVLVYAVALAVVIVAGWLRIPPIIALIAAGVLSGPSALGFIRSPEDVDQLAEIGIVLLLFTVGLEFPMGELRRIWK